MDYKILPLFKSHFSLGKSILTLDEPETKDKKAVPNSLFYILKHAGLDTLVLVDDNISGLLQASKNAKDNKIKLIFGIRLNVCNDMTLKDDTCFRHRAKYIVFAKNSEGYKTLLKIWSVAAREGFYYHSNIDFKTLKKLWNKNLTLAVPFYDSFLFMNSLEGHIHVPELDGFNPVFFKESNSLPFDDLIATKVDDYCKKNGHETIPAQSIFYKSAVDFLAYMTFRCIHNRGFTQKTTIDKPELNHMGSDEFNFDKWLAQNK